jgi:AraC family transcriptional activator of pobA
VVGGARAVFNELESARAKLGTGCDATVISYMFVILFAAIRTARHVSGQGAQPTDQASTMSLVMSFRGLVEDKFRQQLRLLEYCDLLRTSPTRLSRACKSLLSRTPSAIIHERLLFEAKRQIRFSRLSISEIAHGLGFEDAAYFCRFFKQHAGFSPLEFRKASIERVA